MHCEAFTGGNTTGWSDSGTAAVLDWHTVQARRGPVGSPVSAGLAPGHSTTMNHLTSPNTTDQDTVLPPHLRLLPRTTIEIMIMALPLYTYVAPATLPRYELQYNTIDIHYRIREMRRAV